MENTTIEFNQPSESSQQAEQVIMPTPEIKYAGFWIRWVAYFIDILVVTIFQFALSFIFAIILVGVGMNSSTTGLIGGILVALFSWSYFIFMTIKYQATLGKMAVGIRVISDKSTNLTTRQVILRELLGKLISSAILFIGYIMAGFTEKKQALHDTIAKTYVVYKDPNKKIKVWVWILVAILPVLIILGILATIVLTRLNSARGKAQDASVKSYLASAIPLAIAFNDEKGSLVGFDPVANPSFNLNFPACSGKPIVNISSDGSQMAIFAKLCSDQKKYFCVDTVDMGQEVDESYALSEKSVCAELSSEQVKSVNGSINNTNNNPINSQISPSNLGNAQANDNNLNQSFDKSIISNIRYISSQLEYYKSINKNYKGFLVNEADKPRLMFDVSGCKSKMKIDISPTKEAYVIYAPSCTDPNISFCVEQQTDTNPINPVSASTALVEKTYRCE